MDDATLDPPGPTLRSRAQQTFPPTLAGQSERPRRFGAPRGFAPGRAATA